MRFSMLCPGIDTNIVQHRQLLCQFIRIKGTKCPWSSIITNSLIQAIEARRGMGSRTPWQPEQQG